MQRVLTFGRFLTFKRARTYAAVLLLLFVAAWVYELRSGTPPLYGDNVPIGGDYIAFHAAGRLLLNGRGPELYDRAAIVAVQDELLRGRAPGFYDGFRNPPFFALPFAALAPLDLVPGFALWSVVSLACLFLGLRLFIRELQSETLEKRWRGLLILVFAFAPVYFGLIDGENATLSLLLYVLLYRALRREQYARVGVLAALGLFKPQLFLIFPLVLLARRSPRGLLAYGLTAMALAAVSFALVGASGMQAWLRILVEPEAGQVVVNTWRMASLKSFLDALMPAFPLVAWLLFALGALALVILVFRLWSNRRASVPNSAWIMTSLAGVLIDPHLVDYDLTVLVPAGILAVREVPGVRWLLVPLYLVLVFRAHVPLGDTAGVQLSTVILTACLAITLSTVSHAPLAWRIPDLAAFYRGRSIRGATK